MSHKISNLLIFFYTAKKFTKNSFFLHLLSAYASLTDINYGLNHIFQ